MPETDAPTPDIPDGWDPLDSGRFRLQSSGRIITLRTPTLGDVKKLKGAYYDAAKKVEEAAPGKARSDAESDAWSAWLKLAVDTLGDGKLPSGKGADSLPAYWFTLQFAAMLINGWQTVPPPLGAATP